MRTRFVGVKVCPCGKTFTVDRPASMAIRVHCSKRCGWDAKIVARPSDRTGRARAEKLYPGEPCEVCQMPYGGRGRVQRHHRDSDRSNNARSNIAFLCVLHHKAAHKLTDGKVGGGRRERVARMMHDRAVTNAQYAVGQVNAGRTIADVAGEIGVHPTSVSRWFRKYREDIAA